MRMLAVAVSSCFRPPDLRRMSAGCCPFCFRPYGHETSCTSPNRPKAEAPGLWRRLLKILRLG